MATIFIFYKFIKYFFHKIHTLLTIIFNLIIYICDTNILIRNAHSLKKN